jgi:hypothetical protein
MNAGGRATKLLVHQHYASSQNQFYAQACGAQVASEASPQPQAMTVEIVAIEKENPPQQAKEKKD